MKRNIILLIAFVVLGAAAIFIYKKQTGSTLSGQPLTEFAIQDTASISKIFLTDNNGKTVTIERTPNNGLWTLNGKYKARRDAVNNLLQTINRIRVRGAVSAASRDNMMRVLASAGKKVEIYTGGDEPAKIYYVGTSTPDHMGTVMLLEIPGIGRAEDPYITHMEGFTGFLTPRFFTDEMEWRYTGYFAYPNLEFSEVQVIDNYNPQNSFGVQYKGGNNISLFAGYQPGVQAFSTSIPNYDSVAVKDLLILFKKVHFDSYNTLLRREAIDSINKVVPAYTLRVKENTGKVKELNLYNKRAAKREFDAQGNESPWDGNFYWAKTEEGEFALAQKFVFNPILLPLGAYLKKPL